MWRILSSSLDLWTAVADFYMDLEHACLQMGSNNHVPTILAAFTTALSAVLATSYLNMPASASCQAFWFNDNCREKSLPWLCG